MNIENNLMVFGSSPDFADNPRGFWEYIIKNYICLFDYLFISS